MKPDDIRRGWAGSGPHKRRPTVTPADVLFAIFLGLIGFALLAHWLSLP